MKWFHRHLNFTVLFFTIFAWILGILIVNFALDITGYAYLPFPGEAYTPFNPYSTEAVYSFDFQAIIDVAVLVSILVYYLVLKKKKRSIWFLLFFLPPLVPTPSILFVIIFQMPFYIVGWITLLALKNKTETQPATKTIN
jgi:hypothetical protein